MKIKVGKQVLKRLNGKTPKFFVHLRNTGLVLAAISGALLTAPVSLPASIVTMAGYILTASGVLAAVSQLPVENPNEIENENENENQ